MYSKIADWLEKGFRRDWLFVGVLAALAVISHRQWFEPESILYFGDWMQWTQSGAKEVARNWGVWQSLSDLGSANYSISFLLFHAVWSLLTNAGLSFAVALKVTHLVPIALLSFLAPYAFARYSLRVRPIAAFGAAVFFGSVTYLLARQSSHLLVAFVFSAAPLLLLSFDAAIKKARLWPWLLFSLLLTICISYELRITLILLFVLVSYAFAGRFLQLWRQRWLVLLSIGVIISLNLYWLLPTALGDLADSISDVANRGLFGDWLVSVRSALSNFDWSWTGGALSEVAKPQPITWYFWLPPLLSLIGIRQQRSEHRRAALFFLWLLIIGVILTKQSDEPVRGLYNWLYFNVPGFNLFRESSKFQLLTSLGYFGLLALGLERLSTIVPERLTRIVPRALPALVAAAVLLGVAVLNLRPLINLRIGALFVGHTQPPEYAAFNASLLSTTDEARTLWVPRVVQWSYFNSKYPRISATEIVAGEWNGGGVTQPGLPYPTALEVAAPLQAPFAQALLSQAAIRYVVVPLSDIQQDDVFKYYASREYFSTMVKELPYLKKVEWPQLGELEVYENPTVIDRFAVTNAPAKFDRIPTQVLPVSVDRLNYSHYHLTISGLSGTSTQYLQLADHYSKAWTLGDGQVGLVGATFGGGVMRSDLQISKTEAGLMQVELTPEFLQASGTAVTKQADGTYTVRLTLLHAGQPWYYRGILLSCLALAAVLGALLGTVLRKYIVRSRVAR